MNTPLEVIAKTLYGEARGEGIPGLRAVATVIYYRAKGKPENFVDVCLKPKQFSCWNGVKDIVIKETEIYEACKLIANQMLKGDFVLYPFPHCKPTHYCTLKLYNTKPPYWATNHCRCDIVGNHIFFEMT